MRGVRKKNVLFHTLGCRFNRYESAEMALELENAGYATVPDAPADVVVVNTCAVTAKSATKCRYAIRNARANNPDATIVATGCYCELDPDEVAQVDGVDIVVGNAGKFDIPAVLADMENGSAKTYSRANAASAPDIMPVRPVKTLQGRTNAYLNVQSGCDDTCSFCVVRFARGKSISAESSAVVRQARAIAGAGIKEMVLSGINIGKYSDSAGVTLAGLMRMILEKSDIRRIRLSSINPNDVTDGIIDLVADSPRVCRHLHIPLQSGSDTVLERMRRPYTAGQYESLLEKLADRAPGVGLGADVMVGFPGETEKEFMETYKLVERSPLMMLHVFSYSPRKGSDAFEMDGAVDKMEAKRRSVDLKKLSAEKGKVFRSGFIGSVQAVLVENKRDRRGALKGFTDNYMPVQLAGPDDLHNEIVPVRITGALDDRLIGEPG